jgi:hypothetical protein
MYRSSKVIVNEEGKHTMLRLPDPYYALEYRQRREEEEARRNLARAALAGRRPFYAPLFAFAGRMMTALGLWIQKRAEARRVEFEPHAEVDHQAWLGQAR